MTEPIRLPGCPQIVVTREWARAWLLGLGFPERGGFGSVDYMVFGRDVSTRRREADSLTSEDLTDLSQPHVKRVLELMKRESK